MRVCVTGATGFIGANLVARLRTEGHWVCAVDIKHSSHRRHLYGRANEFWQGDLRDPAFAVLACACAQRIYHLAADHGGAGYFHSTADFKAANNNLTIDRSVLAAAIQNRVGRLFFASSACTYPVAIQHHLGARALRETDLGQGDGERLYGQAKHMSTLFMEGARQHGLDARSGVFHTIYGPTQDYREPRAKFPTAICRKVLENPSRVEVWGDGSQVRTFLFIDDALDRIEKVMNTDGYWGPVNIGSDEPVTIRECCDWVADAAGVAPAWVWTDGPTGVEHRASDNSEWARRYGGNVQLSAREGFARTYAWLRDKLARDEVMMCH